MEAKRVGNCSRRRRGRLRPAGLLPADAGRAGGLRSAGAAAAHRRRLGARLRGQRVLLRAELLGQMRELAERDGFADKIRCGATVTAVRTVDAEGEETLDDSAAAGVRVTYVDAATGESARCSRAATCCSAPAACKCPSRSRCRTRVRSAATSSTGSAARWTTCRWRGGASACSEFRAPFRDREHADGAARGGRST